MGEPDRVVVRQSTDRLRKPLLAMAPGAALLALTGLALGEMAWLALGAFVIVFVLPLIVVLVMHFRIKRLAQRGENLVYVDWLGRAQLVPASDIATAGFVAITLSSGAAREERLVVERRSEAPPLMVAVGAWDKFEIRRLLAGLGVEVEPFEITVTRKQLFENLPGHAPPFHDRHPGLAGLLAAVVVISLMVGTVLALVVLTE